jgi:hypothetical protein
MVICCPACNSSLIITRNHGRQICGAAGAIGGAASGAASATAGAKTSAALGAIGGPIGSVLGGLAGAILGGLTGCAADSLAGARVGEEIDSRVLDNYQCQRCGMPSRFPKATTAKALSPTGSAWLTNRHSPKSWNPRPADVTAGPPTSNCMSKSSFRFAPSHRNTA